jgi:hypothetical protein
LIEMELRPAVTYVNDAVIPQVRRESITAMRTAADTLRNLADRFEKKGGAAANQPPGSAQSPAASQRQGSAQSQTGGQAPGQNTEPRS